LNFDEQVGWGSLLQLILVSAFFGWMFWAFFRRKRNRYAVTDGPIDEPYKVFTTEFDQLIHARELPSKLLGLSRDFANGHLQTSSNAWKIALSRFDELAVLPPSADQIERTIDLTNTAVVLLVDHSGSMKGEPILRTAIAIRHLTDKLSALGATLEVLGFTTAGWRGGFAREKWIATGRPKRPGRLCALLHIVYKDGDAAVLEEEDLRVMLNPNILRENVDGESIEWATKRLTERPEQRKILIVLSDGAPVDDSTLTENGEGYLWRHYSKIVNDIEALPSIKIGAVYLNSEFESLFDKSVSAVQSEYIMRETLTLIANLVSENDGEPSTRKAPQ
jgi:cobaltochelatase CobT